MPPATIIPTFANESDRLTFLSRLWGVTLTPDDVADWEAYKLLEPKPRPDESPREYYERRRAWQNGRADRRSRPILAKWAGYGLGKTKSQTEAWLKLHPIPNRTQARQAVLLQLQEKWEARLVASRADTARDLLPLVTGIVLNG